MKCKPILLRGGITLQEFIKDTICFGYPHLSKDRTCWKGYFHGRSNRNRM